MILGFHRYVAKTLIKTVKVSKLWKTFQIIPDIHVVVVDGMLVDEEVASFAGLDPEDVEPPVERLAACGMVAATDLIELLVVTVVAVLPFSEI